LLFELIGNRNSYDLSPHIAGKGKYSVVYEARRKDDGRVCALKRINKDCLRTSQAKSRVVKEIRLLKSLDHINIVKHRKYFLENDELYIELEWADGGDLRSVIKKYEKRGKHLKENDVWHYFTQVARAVRHMHERRVMHRDLKPANIFLTKNGIVKVGDLGLGRELSENSHEAHSRVGTPLYMAPQILKGEGYDWKSDIWSMGCILYELARLQSPFRTGMRPHTELIKLMEHVIRGVYPPIPDSLNYSKDLKDLVMIMLAFDPSQRPTAAEVCLSAESILQNRRALAIAHNDSLSLQVQLNVSGTPIDITVLGHIDSENTFTVPSTIYNYLGAVAIRVSATGIVSGNTGNVNVKLAQPDGSTTLIFGDLNFTGTK